MLEDVKNVEQSVTFYNVTGYIEKENRIYFAPLNKQLVANAQPGTTKPLCQWYKDYFDSVVGILSSRYQNVSISRWSPSDRTLSVQGTIDLFRKSGVSSDSKAFNYMIVKRIVTGVTSQDASINYTYYMGYFITDVQQSGTNTVRLTLDIDNFTNAFYLMNTKQYSDSELLNLDIFNSTLVNCNVERQHYNRVKLVDGEVKIDNNEIFLNPLESYDYKYQKKVSKSPILVNGVTEQVLVFKEQTFTDSNNHYSEFISGREYIIKALTPVAPVDPTNCEITFSYDPNNNGEDYVTLVQYDKDDNEEVAVFGMYVTKIAISRGSNAVTVTYYDPFGVPHTTMTEVVNPNSTRYYWTLKFGRTIKPNYTLTTGASDSVARNVFNEMNTYRYFETTEPIYNFTKEELETLKNTTVSSWGALDDGLRRKCLSASIYFVYIKAKENIGACYGAINVHGEAGQGGSFEDPFTEGYKPNKVRGLLNKNIVDSIYSFILPIIIIPNFLKQFEEIINSTLLSIYVRSLYFTATSNVVPTNKQASWRRDWSDYRLAEQGKMVSIDRTQVTEADLSYGTIPNETILTLLGGTDWADVIISASIIKDLPIDTYEIVDSGYSVGLPPEIRINSNIIELVHDPVPNIYPSEPTYYPPAQDINFRILQSLYLPKGLWFNIIPPERRFAVPSGEEGTHYYDSKDFCISGDHNGLYSSKGYLYSGNAREIESDIPVETPSAFGNIIVFQLSGMDTKNIVLGLEEKDISSIVTSYYDPILENNPYTFFSISLSTGIEVPLNKQKYYNCYDNLSNMYLVPFKYVFSNNDALKLGVIPMYTIDDFETEYYTDALILTLSYQLPLATDSYLSYYSQNQAQMKNQYAVNNWHNEMGLIQASSVDLIGGTVAGYLSKDVGGAGAGFVKGIQNIADTAIGWGVSNNVISINQRAQLAGAGAKPDVVKQAGTDISFDLDIDEACLKLNYYRIDDFSYNSIAKGLERFGYLVNRYDALHVADRVGWNYVKLISADFNHYGEHLNLTTEQESDIMDIFKEGVTLLHSPEYLYNQSLHNHETLIDIDD